MHTYTHPLAGKTVKVHPLTDDHQLLVNGADFEVEDWWDKLTGKSWQDGALSNFACMNYDRRIAGKLPYNDEVVYGHIADASNHGIRLGYLVHVSELGE